jgi:hypothetical protein
MDAVDFYLLFALTTAIAAQLELVNPVISLELEKNGSVENLSLIKVVMFLLNLLAAPLVFLSCIIPSWGIEFRDSLSKAFFSKENS